MKQHRVLLTAGLVFCADGVQAHRPFSQTSGDSASNLFFLLFFLLGIVLFFAPIIALIIGFVSRRVRPAWFIVPFTITALFGLFHTVAGAIDFATKGEMPGSFYWGCVYVGLALIALLGYLRKGSKQAEH